MYVDFAKSQCQIGKIRLKEAFAKAIRMIEPEGGAGSNGGPPKIGDVIDNARETANYRQKDR